MVPTDLNKVLPQALKESLSSSDGGTALVSKWNELYESIRLELVERRHFKDPERIPYDLLEAKGEFLSAGILGSDSERVKRQKIKYAVQNHKKKSLWDEAVKLLIDFYLGRDSDIWGSLDNPQWVLLSGEADDPEYKWGSLGGDGIDESLGLWLVGDGTEYCIKGIVYIDTDNPSISSTTQIISLQTLWEELKNQHIPSYFRIFMGYTGSENLIGDQTFTDSSGFLVPSTYTILDTSDGWRTVTIHTCDSGTLVYLETEVFSVGETGYASIDFESLEGDAKVFILTGDSPYWRDVMIKDAGTATYRGNFTMVANNIISVGFRTYNPSYLTGGARFRFRFFSMQKDNDATVFQKVEQIN